MRDVLVLGAGMAGVTVARELARAGLEVVVVEARDRIGGRIRSIRDFCGGAVEAGAEFVHGLGARTWPEVREAGLAVRAHRLRNTMLNLGGGTRWAPWIVLHPGCWRSLPLLRQLGSLGPPDLSGADYVSRRGFRGRGRTVAEMVIAAHLPGALDEIGMLGLLEDGVLHLEQGVNHRISAGYDALPGAMASGLDVQRGFAVKRIDWSSEGVVAQACDGRELSARSAVCTLPVGVLQSHAVRFVPELPDAKHAALRQLVMGPVLKLLLRFEERFWPRWCATLGCGPGPVTLYWPVFQGSGAGPAVLTAYCTGPRAARMGRLSVDEAADVCLHDLQRLFPRADPHRRLLDARRIDWAADPFARGGYTFLRPGGCGARAKLAAADTGALFWAGSATESRPIAASVEAAYVSGLRAAEEVRGWLERRPAAAA